MGIRRGYGSVNIDGTMKTIFNRDMVVSIELFPTTEGLYLIQMQNGMILYITPEEMMAI